MSVGKIKASAASMAQGSGARRAPRRDTPPKVEFARAVVFARITPVDLAERTAAVAVAPTTAFGDAPAPIAAYSPAPLARPLTRPSRPRSWRSTRGRRVLAAFVGMTLAGGGAYAATNWIVGLGGGSSSLGQSATVQNLTVTAVTTPSPGSLLYPGGTGDVVLTISNPNPYPVTVTGVNLPTNATYATGYTTSALSVQQTGCISTTPSDVVWNYASSTSGSAHTLTTALVVGPSGNSNNPLTVTLTNDASMTAAAPAACENTYFSMPSFTGVAASGGAGTVTPSPATDAWTS